MNWSFRDSVQSQLLSDCRLLLVSGGGKHPSLQAKILHHFISGASERFWFSLPHAYTKHLSSWQLLPSQGFPCASLPAAVVKRVEICHTPPRPSTHLMQKKIRQYLSTEQKIGPEFGFNSYSSSQLNHQRQVCVATCVLSSLIVLKRREFFPNAFLLCVNAQQKMGFRAERQSAERKQEEEYN